MLKKIFVFFIVFTLISSCCSAEVAGDLDGNGSITVEDIAYFMAWFIKGRTTDKSVVVNRAKELYPNATGPVVRLPDPAKDNFFGKDSVSLNDIAILMAFFMKGRTSDFSAVQIQANNLYSGTDFVSKLPGTPIGDSSFTTTITGITTDP
jgi:hypothetical protein